MTTFLVLGLIQGAVYGLVAIGLALVYKGARVFNFAQGEYGTVAAFIAWIVVVQRGWPYGFGMIAGLLAAVAMGLVMERVVVRPLFSAPRVTLLVATAGVALLAISIELIVGEAQGRILPAAVSGRGVRVFGVAITAQRIFILLALVAIAAALAWFFSRTATGLAILAMAQEPMATRIVGIRITRMSSIVWGLAALLGGLAGLLQAPLFPFFPGEMTTVALLPGFTAAVLGGITSLWGALAGGLIVGAIQGLAQFYIGERIPGGSDLVVFLVLLGVLLFRPGGLFGKTPSRVEDGGQTPQGHAVRFRFPTASLGAMVPRWTVLAAIVIGILVVPRLLPAFRSDQVSLALIFAMVGLSINVIMGYAGQISLGHQAFVGIGAFTSANLVTEQGASFWIALPIAAATGAVAAGGLGLVALRLRGLYLALITLAYGAVAERSIFGIRELTRGGAGMPAPRPPGFTSDHAFTYLCFAFLALILFVDWRFTNSKGGRAVLAIRQNEMVAASYGVDVTRYKVFAFVLSGVFAGVAGSLFAHWRQTVVANDFNFQIALTFVLMTVVGGLGSRTGVMIGSAFFALFPLIFSSLTVYVPAVGAALLIFTLVRHAGGIGEQVEPLVRYFKGEVPGKIAGAQTLVLLSLICVLGVVLSAVAAQDVRVVGPVALGLGLWTMGGRLPDELRRRALRAGAAVAWIGAVLAAVLTDDLRVIMFAVPVPILVRLAVRLHHSVATAIRPAQPVLEEREPVGAA